ncbi:MAG: NUDIX hydrolase [Halobacteriota archaeon]
MDLGPIADRDPTLVSNPQRAAAVLVPVIEGSGGPELLFIRRAPDLAEHPGEMGFPGGGAEPIDRDRWETAVREAGEEIGLQPTEIEYAGRLDDVSTTTGYTISPFVARVPQRIYEPVDGEVAAIASLPVSALYRTENHRFEPREHPEYGTVPVHHFRVDGYTIWGATARILTQLLSLSTDWTEPEPPARPLGELIGD